MMDGYSAVPLISDFVEDERRVIELALRNFVGTYDEVLLDPALGVEERQAFAKDRDTALRLLEE